MLPALASCLLFVLRSITWLRRYQDNDAIYLLTNLYQGGELFSLLHSDEGDAELEPEIARFYVANVLLALEFVHDRGLVYRDL